MEEELKIEPVQKSMLDPYKMWKKLYFSTEDTLSSAVRKSVNTDEYAKGMEFILNSYLQYLNLQNEFLTRYMKDSPFSSKQDVARVAELVVSLETKVDNLEGDLEEKLMDIGTDTRLLAQQLTRQKQPDNVTAEALSSAFSPTMTTLKDIRNRVSDLEKMVKRVETNLTEMNKRMTSGAEKKSASSRAPKIQKPTPQTTPKE